MQVSAFLARTLTVALVLGSVVGCIRLPDDSKWKYRYQDEKKQYDEIIERLSKTKFDSTDGTSLKVRDLLKDYAPSFNPVHLSIQLPGLKTHESPAESVYEHSMQIGSEHETAISVELKGGRHFDQKPVSFRVEDVLITSGTKRELALDQLHAHAIFIGCSSSEAAEIARLKISAAQDSDATIINTQSLDEARVQLKLEKKDTLMAGLVVFCGTSEFPIHGAKVTTNELWLCRAELNSSRYWNSGTISLKTNVLRIEGENRLSLIKGFNRWKPEDLKRHADAHFDFSVSDRVEKPNDGKLLIQSQGHVIAPAPTKLQDETKQN